MMDIGEPDGWDFTPDELGHRWPPDRDTEDEHDEHDEIPDPDPPPSV